MMDENKGKGFVYILEVKDIDLPVCKIGMTTRNPRYRCSEINNNSTGDFIWQVAYQFSVDNCQKLESLAHKKLEPLRQKNREFFNITAEVAYSALCSIIENQSEIQEITIEESTVISSKEEGSESKRKRTKHTATFRKIDTEYAELLLMFTSLIGAKGRAFGQISEPLFGMSDGNNGVQWNLAILTDINQIRLGVNLEGMAYSNWPITTFILSELENPSIEKLKTNLARPESIFIQCRRNAWRCAARPAIVERYIGGNVIPLSEVDSKSWASILTEALGCLNDQKQYRGRKEQLVTFVKKTKNGEQTKIMEVSPHLTIWTPINLAGDNLEHGIELLKPIYEWVSKTSQQK